MYFSKVKTAMSFDEGIIEIKTNLPFWDHLIIISLNV